MKSFKRIACAALLGVATAVSAGAHAAWPDRPIALVVPYPPGGNTDILGRLVGNYLSKSLGQTVVVENKPGAGSMLGSSQVVRAEPDGYTLLVGSIANSLNQYFYKKPLYDMNTDLEAVSQLVNVPNYISLGPKEEFNSLKEVIDYAKKNPKKISCATTGVGTSTYLTCEMIKSMTGADIVNVPYKGGAAAMQDAMGGQVNMVIANESLALIKEKRLKGLAVTTKERSSLAPELAAVSETIPGFDLSSWYGVFAPKGTPPEIKERVAKEIATMMKDKDVQDRLEKLGATGVGSSPANFDKFVKNEMTKWQEVTGKLNIQLD